MILSLCQELKEKDKELAEQKKLLAALRGP